MEDIDNGYERKRKRDSESGFFINIINCLEERVAEQNEEIVILRRQLEEKMNESRHCINIKDLLISEKDVTIAKMEKDITKRDQQLQTSKKNTFGSKEMLAPLHLQIQDKLECPVCLDLPRNGNVFSCPNGHLVCARCKRNNCPYCREEMGATVSLLASMLLKNIPHKCKFEGCLEQHPVDLIENHERKCNHRLVFCPSCSDELSLSSLISHCNNSCRMVYTKNQNATLWRYSSQSYDIQNDSPTTAWQTDVYLGDLANCVLQVKKKENIFEVVVIILGEVNEKLKVEIILHTANSRINNLQEDQVCLKYCGLPCSIDVEETKRKSYDLLFCDQVLSNMFKKEEFESFTISFKLIIK